MNAAQRFNYKAVVTAKGLAATELAVDAVRPSTAEESAYACNSQCISIGTHQSPCWRAEEPQS